VTGRKAYEIDVWRIILKCIEWIELIVTMRTVCLHYNSCKRNNSQLGNNF
jgi:hypothetical protein